MDKNTIGVLKGEQQRILSQLETLKPTKEKKIIFQVTLELTNLFQKVALQLTKYILI